MNQRRSIGLQDVFLHFSSSSSSSKNHMNKKRISSNSNSNSKIGTPRIHDILSSPTYTSLFQQITRKEEEESIKFPDSVVEKLRSWQRMEFTANEVEDVTQSVTDYHFVDDQEELVSFASLPVRWSRSETLASDEKHIFLHGSVDSGSKRIFKKVIAWMCEYSNDQPEVSVLSWDKRWIKLQKPKNSFEDTLRTTLITIQCLHFLKKHPDKSESFMWRHLQEAFSFYKVKPSENDVLNHLPLIQAVIRRDRTLEKSEFMQTVLSYTKKRKVLDEDVHYDFAVKKAKFISENEKVLKEQTETTNSHLDESDTLCALCDNGGELFCCDGGCLRAFHGTKDADPGCKSLCLSKDQEHAPRFLCKNCQYNKHQCFYCGKLGSSDRANNAEVFPCSSETCGHFYHPHCAAKLLHPINKCAADKIEEKIFAGESFTCPVHKCFRCKGIENEEVEELRFAICRRCPKVYHKGCLPEDISFKSSVEKGVQRAWTGLLLRNRILIYCTKHKIDERTFAPVDDYIIFPDLQDKKKASSSDLWPSQGKIVAEKIGSVSRNKPQRNPVNKREVLKKPSATNHQNFNKTSAKQDTPGIFDYKKKSGMAANSRFHSRDFLKCASVKGDKGSGIDETDIYLKKESLNRVPNKGVQLVKSKQQGSSCSKSERFMMDIPATKNSSSSTAPLDGMEMRRVDRTKEKSSMKTAEAVERTHKAALTQAYFSDNIVDKPNPPEQVEGSDKVVENIIQHVKDNYGSDPKADYESDSKFLDNITTSKIVDKLGCYVLDGDMVVNFCCRVNDFICLMRQELAKTGKKNCSFKHYDVFQSEGDFDLKEEDWKNVFEEKLTGMRMIVGIKFPSAVQGEVVNNFINKILKFKPKLIFLICTRKTEMLIQKVLSTYDLIWEDSELISCKSFVPGSMQHGTSEPPLLYLWSRCDWTNCHNLTALGRCHISNEQKDTYMEGETDHSIDTVNQTCVPDKISEVEDLKEVIHVEPVNSSVQVQDLEVSRDLKSESGLVDTFKMPPVFDQDSSLFALGHQSPFLTSSCGWLDDD